MVNMDEIGMRGKKGCIGWAGGEEGEWDSWYTMIGGGA